MPKIIVKTNRPSALPLLQEHRKPGYELVVVPPDDPLSCMTAKNEDIHGLIADSDLITPEQVRRVKDAMDDALFPVILLADTLTPPEAGRWIGSGVSDILQLPVPAPLVGRRIGSAVQLYRISHRLQGQVTDKLTGLYNQDAFYHFARELIDKDPDAKYILILSDIENFKRINERFGEEKGDALLRFIGHALGSLTTDTAIFARYGGDRFVGLCKFSGEITQSFLKKQMQRIYDEAPVDHFFVQFGLYENVDTSLPISIMCDRARIALKTIKHQYGRVLARYTPQLQQQCTREQRILDSMEAALTQHQFQVYYQPKHDINTSRIVGAEALVRWTHPEYGFMSPGDFMPMFEESGFISALDAYVWNQVCQDVRKMLDAGLPVVPISVNASRKDMLRESFWDSINQPLNALNLDPALFHMEVTESIYMEDAEILSPRIQRLRNMGIAVELDDFGSGFSSLGVLSKFSVDVMKLDISLIRNMEAQPAIVDSIVRLMHTLGYKVTAEGVETESQIELLRQFGCDCVQGYYYSRPLPLDGFCAYIQAENEG